MAPLFLMAPVRMDPVILVTSGQRARIWLHADNKPLLRDHDHDVLRRPRTVALPRSRGGHGAKVQIDTLEVLDSNLPRRELRLVLAWAEMHSAELAVHFAELAENWSLAREGGTLKEIEPLR
jgi:hypothetical protein